MAYPLDAPGHGDSTLPPGPGPNSSVQCRSDDALSFRAGVFIPCGDGFLLHGCSMPLAVYFQRCRCRGWFC
eukprot:2378403-Pleurochrysis_carterae.AAC.3